MKQQNKQLIKIKRDNKLDRAYMAKLHGKWLWERFCLFVENY